MLEEMPASRLRIRIQGCMYRHANEPFILFGGLKFADLVDLQIAQIIYKTRNNLALTNFQKILKDRDGNLISTTDHSYCTESMCITAAG